MQIQSLTGPDMTSPKIVRMNGDRLMRPVWLTVKLYGADTNITPFTTEKTTIQVMVVPALVSKHSHNTSITGL